MALKGSRSKINAHATLNFAYSTINCRKAFNIVDIAEYDMILGMQLFGEHVEAEIETLLDAVPLRNPLRGKGRLVDSQQSDIDLDELPQSDTSSSEMRVIRGGGDNRSSVPENTINPYDSPRERRTSVAPATRQAGGKSTHALNPAKSDKRPLVDGDKDGESDTEESPSPSPNFHILFPIPLFLFAPTIDKDVSPNHRYAFDHDTVDYSDTSNTLAIEGERRVNPDDQEPLGTIQNGGISTKANPASKKPAERDVESGVLSKELLGASYIYSGMMRAYINSANLTFNSHIHTALNPQPSDLLPQARDFNIDGLARRISDELMTGTNTLVTNRSKSDFKDEEFEDLANQIDVQDGRGH
jgi:hypothetical protein